jgi:drug/metabolite transporter (DMT)-like permease
MIVLLSVMTLLWAGNFIVGKIALREFSIPLLIWFRLILSTILLWIIFAMSSGREELGRLFREWRALAWVGLTWVVLNQLFYAAGIKYTSASHASVISALSPVWVLIFASMTGLERFSRGKILGLAVCLSGVVILTNLRPTHPGPGPSLKGDLLSLGSSLAFGIGTVLGKKLTGRFGAVAINAMSYSFGVLLVAPLGAHDLLSTDLTKISSTGWLALTYMAVGSSVLAYIVYFWAMRSAGATRVAAFSYLQPPLVTLMGMAFLHEHLSGPETACGAVILAGVFLTERG